MVVFSNATSSSWAKLAENV